MKRKKKEFDTHIDWRFRCIEQRLKNAVTQREKTMLEHEKRILSDLQEIVNEHFSKS